MSQSVTIDPATTDPTTGPITMFVGEYAFLSNFWAASVTYNGHTYRTAEHAYQAQKCVLEIERQAIQDMHTAAGAKRAGKRCRCRPDWMDVREEIMADVELAKYEQNKGLGDLLVGTNERELCEGNLHGDTFWGKVPVRMSGGQVRGWRGQNVVGETIMAVRDKLRAEGRP